MSVICNVADLIAADLSPYFFFVFWTAEYAKKRQGAAALFAPKKKRVAPLLHSASPLPSCPSCCRTKVYANRQRRSRMMGTKRMAHFTTRCQEREREATAQGIVSRGTPRRLLPPMQCSGAAVEFRLETNRIPDNGATPV